MVIGGLLGAEALGIWYFAVNAGFGLATSLSAAFSTVLYPNLCAAVDRSHAMGKAMKLGVAIMAPVIVLQAAAAPFYVPVVFGAKWTSLTDLVSILCLAVLPGLVWSATTFRRAGGFELGVSHSEDLAWLIRMAGAGLRIEGIGETLTFYRANEGGLSADLEAMHRGWKLAIAQAAELDPSISPAELRAGEAIHLRYLARRALRTGASARTSLALIGRALVKSPRAYFNHPRHSLSILAGACAALIMPIRIRRHTFGN